jgi:hypothetical protein
MIKRNSGSQNFNLTPNHKGSNDFRLGHTIYRWKDLFEGYKITFF